MQIRSDFEPILTTREQDLVRTKLLQTIERAPVSEKIFVSYGAGISLATCFLSGLAFWRAGFRGFGLAKYNKSRITGVIWTGIGSFYGALFHYQISNLAVHDYYRSENKWNYALRSLFAHVVGMSPVILFSIGIQLLSAERFGMMVLPSDYFAKEHRRETIKLIASRLRPYRKSMTSVYAVGCIWMFYVGLQEFNQSKDMLSKIGRRTLSYRESQV